MYTTSTILESQPDWLTVTCTDLQRIPSFRAWAHRVLDWERVAGNQPRDVGILGYVGRSCGRARWGSREDGDLLMMSGDLANMELHRALERGTNISRIDLAVTVRLDPEDATVEERHYADYTTSPGRQGRRAKASLVQSDDGGATFYLGKRTSEVMLRVYNKAVESRAERYINCHRYELEVKGDRAAITATSAAGSPDVAVFTQEAVYDWCITRGVVPTFPAVAGRGLVPGFRRRSDVDTKLAWLSEQVAPTLKWLSTINRQQSALDALAYDAKTGRFGSVRCEPSIDQVLEQEGGIIRCTF